MPGYIMHMAEGTLILNAMEKKQTKEWEEAFIVGNLLPDTKKKMEKVTSHFWDPDTLEQMAIAPDLPRFLKKYGTKLEDPVLLGYYAHLYLDHQFVTEYWPGMVEFYDDEGRRKSKKEEITKAKLGITGEIVPRDTFFSDEYYYGDYTKLNNYFVQKYEIKLDLSYEEDQPCPIEEVKFSDLNEVMTELKSIMAKGRLEDRKKIKVFSEKRLCSFLENTAKEFAAMLQI